MFLCSADGSRFFAPPVHFEALRAAVVKHGRRPSAELTRSVLDGGKHGAKRRTARGSGSAAEAPALVGGLDVAHRASRFGFSVVQSRPKPRGGTIA
jgi:hypothetical protein